MRLLLHHLAVVIGAAILLLTAQVLARADTPDDGRGAIVNPFPDINVISAYYTELSPDEFSIPDHPGVWFLSATGMNCGIWVWGSFGCAGDIPGAPPGGDHIAWFNGNRAVHHGWTAAVQYPAGQAQNPLPPLTYVKYEQSICATTVEGNTFCGHGPFQFLTTQQGTWLKGWDDRRSYVCNSYGSCPQG